MNFYKKATFVKSIIDLKDLENRKKELYLSNPKLQEIDEKLSSLSINTAKSILQNNSAESLSTLKENISKLRQEKEKLLKKE